MYLHFSLYTDDTAMVIPDKLRTFLDVRCNKLVIDLADDNLQTAYYFSLGKTHLNRFHNRKKFCGSLGVAIDDTTREQLSSFKFLGVQRDEN